MKRFLSLTWLIAVWLLAGGWSAVADEPAKPAAEKTPAEADQPADAKKPAGPKFIRVRRDDAGKPAALETAVVHYVSADGKRPGVSVDLVGAVHVGDKAYYEALNKLFESYDVVLYELVAPEGTRIPKEGREQGNAHPVAALQNGMSTMLELQHQLDHVDYTKENLLHADMSPEEFNKTMQKRGESFLQMFLRMMGQGLAQQAAKEKSGDASGEDDLGLLLALFSRDRAWKLKTMMAEQFEDLEGQMALFDGPDGSTIITERNKRAFEVLDKQLGAGKKKIAVFYGAGHFPDMEKRLAESFGLKRDSEQWLVAWDLVKKKRDPKAPKLDVIPELKIELP